MLLARSGVVSRGGYLNGLTGRNSGVDKFRFLLYNLHDAIEYTLRYAEDTCEESNSRLHVREVYEQLAKISIYIADRRLEGGGLVPCPTQSGQRTSYLVMR